MKTIRTIDIWMRWRASISKEASVGFVPTMGALHDGHCLLIRRCREENDVCVVSLFVNPTQFDNAGDLKAYPVSFEEDQRICEGIGVDVLLSPVYDDLYPDDYRYRMTENQQSRLLCGRHRPGHFDGVLTVVMKLINLVNPHRVYFGEKDYQQLRLVQGMVAAFFMPVQVVACPTVREADGLALSSRNRRLSERQRRQSAAFPRLLSTEQMGTEEVKEALTSQGFKVDYVEDFQGHRCAAVHVGDVRLIDNRPLKKGNSP